MADEDDQEIRGEVPDYRIRHFEMSESLLEKLVISIFWPLKPSRK